MLYKCFVFYWEGPCGTPQPPPISGIVRREGIPFRSETCSPQSDHNNVPLPPYSPSGSATDLPRTKSWDISLDCHIGKNRGVIRSKMFLLESVTFQFHARMLSSEVAQSLKSYGHFSDLGVGIAVSHRHVGFFW